MVKCVAGRVGSQQSTGRIANNKKTCRLTTDGNIIILLLLYKYWFCFITYESMHHIHLALKFSFMNKLIKILIFFILKN